MLVLLAIQVVVAFLYESLWFLIGLRLSRNDVADVAWGIGFIILAVVGLFSADGITWRSILALSLVAIWGVRLSAHIWIRNKKKTEDPRYLKWRNEWGRYATVRAYFQLFLFQGLLMVIILFPVSHIMVHGRSDFTWIDTLGIAVWLGGGIFETVGDLQLVRFKNNPDNRGRVIMSGLWKYTRHPNYFGEVMLWWGLWLLACSVPGGWKTFIGPSVVTVLILFISGIPLLEKRYEGSIEFEDYRRRTSAFLPLPPKQ